MEGALLRARGGGCGGGGGGAGGWLLARWCDKERVFSTGGRGPVPVSTGSGQLGPSSGRTEHAGHMSQNQTGAWRGTPDSRAWVTGRRQAMRAGLTRNMVRRRLASGRWYRLQRGAYATFSGPVPRQSELWAALLRAGPGATLSHQTAAELHGLTDQLSEQIHVTVPVARNPARCGKIPGVIVHRSSRIGLARHPALAPPRTRVEETVLDLVETARDFDE